MSIIISAMYQDFGFIASDKRLSYLDGRYEDNFKKIYQIGNKKLYCGITGVTDYVFDLYDQINKFSENNIDYILEKADEIIQISGIKATITLIGTDETNKFFIWSKNNAGEKIYKKEPINGDLIYNIASTDNIDKFNTYFETKIIEGLNIKDSIINTIKYASNIDKTISEKFDLYIIQKEQNGKG